MKIKIAKTPWQDALEVVLYEEHNGKRYVVKPVDLVIEELKEGLIVEPTFRITGINQHEFIKSMAEIAEEQGIKTDKQLKIDRQQEGKLEATQYHLEDMRRLVFEEPKVEIRQQPYPVEIHTKDEDNAE